MKRIKEFLMEIDWIICQTIGVLFLMQDAIMSGCILMILAVYLSEKNRKDGKRK
jgi:hypothetical protein